MKPPTYFLFVSFLLLTISQFGFSQPEQISELTETRRHNGEDASILTNDEKVDGHNQLLAVSSTKCYSKLFSCNQDKTTNTSEIKNESIEPEAFKIMADFIYTKNLTFDSVRQALDVYKASNKFRMENLKKLAENYINANIEKDNVLVILEFSKLYNVTETERLCMELIRNDTENILKSENFLNCGLEALKAIVNENRLNIEEMKLLEYIEKWAKYQTEIKGASLVELRPLMGFTSIIHRIRVLLMTQEKFVSFVIKSVLLTSDEKQILLMNLITSGNAVLPNGFSNSTKPQTITQCPVTTPSPCQKCPVTTPSPCPECPVSTPSPCQKCPVTTPSPCQKCPVTTPSPCPECPVTTPSPCQKCPVTIPSPCQKCPVITPSPCQKCPVTTPSTCPVTTPSPCPECPVITPSPSPECAECPEVRPSPPIIKFLPPSSHLGCFNDSGDIRLLKDSVGTYPLQANESCIDECSSRGYLFAGLKFGNKCYCGDKFVANRMTSDETCEGDQVIRVYSINDTSMSRNIEVHFNWSLKDDVFKDTSTLESLNFSPFFYLNEYRLTILLKMVTENGSRFFRVYLFCDNGTYATTCNAKLVFAFSVIRDNGEPWKRGPTTFLYEGGAAWGWPNFMDKKDLLDGGYIKNGFVHFKASVRIENGSADWYRG